MAGSIARLAIHFAADVTGLKAGIAQVNQQLASVGKGMSGAAAGVGGKGGGGLLGAAGISAGTAGILGAIGVALGGVSAWAIKLSSEIQTLNLQFEILTGSAQSATAILSELKQLAADTPLGLQEVGQAAKILLSMGENKAGVVAQVEMLGDVAAISGKPLNELAIIYGQVMQAGRLTSNELLQFNQANIPLLQKLSEMLGVSTFQVRKLIEEGKVGADVVVKAFREMTSEGGLASGAMSRNLETLSGQWGKLWDRIKMFGAEAFKGPTDALTLLLSSANQVLDLFGGKSDSKTAGSRKAQLDAVQANKEADTRRIEAEKEATALREAAEKTAREMQKRADSISQSLRQPSEVFADTIAELRNLQEKGLIDLDTYARGVKKAMGDLRTSEEKFNPGLIAPQPQQGIAAVEAGTTAAFSAIQQATRDAAAQLDYQKQMLEVEKREQALLEKILAAQTGKQQFTVKKASL